MAASAFFDRAWPGKSSSSDPVGVCCGCRRKAPLLCEQERIDQNVKVYLCETCMSAVNDSHNRHGGMTLYYCGCCGTDKPRNEIASQWLECPCDDCKQRSFCARCKRAVTTNAIPGVCKPCWEAGNCEVNDDTTVTVSEEEEEDEEEDDM